MPTEQLLMYETAPLQAGEWPQTEDCPTSWEDLSTTQPERIEVSTYPGLSDEIDRATRNVLSLDELKDPTNIGYSEETLKRAVQFLTEHLLAIWSRYGIIVPVPRIGPGPGGSVDLYWKQPSWELLINIPTDSHAPASFYGDNYGKQRIRGNLELRQFNLGIATWLMS